MGRGGEEEQHGPLPVRADNFFLIGNSINLYVRKAKNIEINSSINLIYVACLPPSIIFINDIMGQCQRYRGKLNKPNHTKKSLEVILELTNVFSPPNMRNKDPNTGINVKYPGVFDSRLIRVRAIAIKIKPANEKIFFTLAEVKILQLKCIN